MVIAVVLLVLVALIGGLVVWFVHDLTMMYGDPTQSELANLGWGWVWIALLLVGLAALAARVSPAHRRRAVAWHGVVLLVAFAVAVPVANHLGLEAMRASSSAPPDCGIGGETKTEFESIEHPGYFGGGENDLAGCTYLMTVTDLGSALDSYEKELRGRGYAVVRTEDSLTATRDRFTFSARRGYGDIDDGRTMTVSLRTS